eukprot:5072842-Heterocapsa_arctica.AAC.1
MAKLAPRAAEPTARPQRPPRVPPLRLWGLSPAPEGPLRPGPPPRSRGPGPLAKVPRTRPRPGWRTQRRFPRP